MQLILNMTVIRCLKGEEVKGRRNLKNMLGRIMIFIVLFLSEVQQLNYKLFIFFTCKLKEISKNTEETTDPAFLFSLSF